MYEYLGAVNYFKNVYLVFFGSQIFVTIVMVRYSVYLICTIIGLDHPQFMFQLFNRCYTRAHIKQF
jgi:hypothetical protein